MGTMGLRHVWVACLVVLASAGCSAGEPAPVSSVQAPAFAAPVEATPSPLAIEPTDSAEILPTEPPTKAAAFYKPPAWDGSSDVDCPDFDTHAHAQSFFLGTEGTTTHDPYRLDADHDGLACETLP